MAYKNLVNQSITTREEFFTHIRDFVCARNATHNYSATGIGWNYIDYSYATDEDNPATSDWFVISSTGENGSEQMYYRFELTSTTSISIRQFLYYDPATHTGTYGTTAASILNNSTWNKIFIYGNLDYVYPIVEYNVDGSCYGGFFGKFGSTFDEGIQIVSGTLTAGNDVSIVVNDTSSYLMEVDRYVFIYDNTNIERALIKTNNGSTTITVDLVNSYSASSKLRGCWPYSMDTSYSNFLLYSREVINLAGTLNYNRAIVAMCGAISANTANPGAQNHINCTRYQAMSSTANIGHVLKYPNVYRGILQSSLSLYDVLVDRYGNDYRYIKIGGNIYWYIREV